MDHRDRKPKMKDTAERQGTWETVETIEDPDSKVGLILSERIRGRPAYSIQIIHHDEVGLNKHVPVSPPGAKHELKHIVYSLVARAQEIILERKAKEAEAQEDRTA
jgi:hypothetical protein